MHNTIIRPGNFIATFGSEFSASDLDEGALFSFEFGVSGEGDFVLGFIFFEREVSSEQNFFDLLGWQAIPQITEGALVNVVSFGFPKTFEMVLDSTKVAECDFFLFFEMGRCFGTETMEKDI